MMYAVWNRGSSVAEVIAYRIHSDILDENIQTMMMIVRP